MHLLRRFVRVLDELGYVVWCLAKGCGMDGTSKKKRTNHDTPESVAVKFEACSLTHKTRTHNSRRKRVFKKIATMKKLKKKVR